MQFAAGLGYLSKTSAVRLSAGSAQSPAGHESDSGVLDEVSDEDEDDGAAVAPGASAAVGWATATLWICYSHTYQVPVLYFNVFAQCNLHALSPTIPPPALTDSHCSASAAGAPLALPAILGSSLFHQYQRTMYPFTTIPELSNLQDDHQSDTPPNSIAPGVPAAANPAPPAPFVSQAEHPALNTPAWFLHPCETQAIVAEVLSMRSGVGQEGVEREWEREWVESWAMVVGGVVDLRG